MSCSPSTAATLGRLTGYWLMRANVTYQMDSQVSSIPTNDRMVSSRHGRNRTGSGSPGPDAISSDMLRPCKREMDHAYPRDRRGRLLFKRDQGHVAAVFL